MGTLHTVGTSVLQWLFIASTSHKVHAPTFKRHPILASPHAKNCRFALLATADTNKERFMKKLNCKRGTTLNLRNPMLLVQFALMQTGKLGVLTPDMLLSLKKAVGGLCIYTEQLGTSVDCDCNFARTTCQLPTEKCSCSSHLDLAVVEMVRAVTATATALASVKVGAMGEGPAMVVAEMVWSMPLLSQTAIQLADPTQLTKS
jgi:hypothetical protein